MERTTRISGIRGEILWDHDPDLSWLQQDYNDVPADEALRYRAQDAERLAAFDRGDWYMVGVRAAAEIELPADQISERDWRLGTTYTIHTPGIWSVESDSGEDYFREIIEGELPMIADDLRAMRFSDEEIRAAMPTAAAARPARHRTGRTIRRGRPGVLLNALKGGRLALPKGGRIATSLFSGCVRF